MFIFAQFDFVIFRLRFGASQSAMAASNLIILMSNVFFFSAKWTMGNFFELISSVSAWLFGQKSKMIPSLLLSTLMTQHPHTNSRRATSKVVKYWISLIINSISSRCVSVCDKLARARDIVLRVNLHSMTSFVHLTLSHVSTILWKRRKSVPDKTTTTTAQRRYSTSKTQIAAERLKQPNIFLISFHRE